jgi:hypothetical protein
MPLQQGDHPALVFLHRELLPFIIAGRRVKRRWFVWLDGVARYTGDLAAALAGLGVGGPLVGAFAHPAEPAHEASADLWTRLTEQLGPSWVYIGFAAIIVWIFVRLVTQNESVTQRATLAKQFALDNESGYGKLDQALHGHVPRDLILEVYRSTMDRVQTALTKEIWPYKKYRPPVAAYQPELDRLTDEIRTNYMRDWEPPQPGQEW